VGMLIAAAVLLLLVGGYFYQRFSSQKDSRKYPPLGKLVKTSRGEVHLLCQGQGDVTVVLEAAQGDSSLDWAGVHAGVAKFSKVCAYDRPGYGWSSSVSEILTADKIAENLHQALQNGDVSGPYILVGHSIGGIYVRAFAQLFPQEVAGLVLVDSAHENQRFRLPSSTRKQISILKALVLVLRAIVPFGIPRALGLADRMQGENFPDDTRPAAMARMNQTHFFTAMYNEIKAVELDTDQANPPSDLGDMPLAVLTQGGLNPDISADDFEQMKQIWNELQKELTQLSTNGRQLIAHESGHYIHHDQPELVIEVIQNMVEMIQNEGRSDPQKSD
jgi:pimeloyl-ACP methyl ester carboxylesterase